MADRLIPFPRGEQARRAAVSSFGFGGTNVHVILEEAPLPKPASISRPRQLVLLSAKSSNALDAYSRSMAGHFATAQPESLADAAFTLQTGRRQMAFRRFAVAANSREAADLLTKANPLRCGSKHCERRNPPVVFLFGGQGTQYVNMGLNLYRDEPLFRAVVDDCCEILKPHLGRDLREILYPKSGDEEAAEKSLQDTLFTQPSIFVTEFALARLWQSLGIKPDQMAGHSVGEFVAATLAGVWELADVLSIIALRGRLMQSLPRGSMLAVSSSADVVKGLLPAALQIASINAPSLCVVTGAEADVRAFQAQMEAKKIGCKHLQTSHAFHSAMIDPIIEPLREAIAKVKLRAPLMPFVSTVSGRPISADEATDPAYWASHARSTVQFAKAISYLKNEGHDLFLECGPRATLCSLVRKQFTPGHPCTAIPTLADTAENNAEWSSFLFALGSLWQNGVSIDWDAFYAHEDRRRVALPTYPFERKRFWVDPVPSATKLHAEPERSAVIANPAAGRTIDSPSGLQASARAPRGASQSSRKDCIAARVIELLLPVSGRERAEISNAATFMEQGFDSLSLTQAAFAIGKEFSVKLSFSQLMNQFPNVEMLAEHLDAILPVGILAEASVLEASLTNVQALAPAGNAAQTNGRLEEMLAQQADTIARLVALLESAGVKQPIAPATASGTGLATLVVDAQRGAASSHTTEGRRDYEAESTIPQRGIFASSRLCEPLSAAYNESVTLRLTGAISAEKIKRVIERLVERHEALRASFDKTGRVMLINPDLKIAVPVTELFASEPFIDDSVWKDEGLRKLIADEVAVPFPLPEGPLVRSQIVLLGRDRAAVIFDAHHSICDGWSLDVLIRDFCALYSEEVSGVPQSLEPAESYLDYVGDIAKLQKSLEFEQAATYWRRKFSGGFPMLVLPTDRPRHARREFKARTADLLIPASVAQELRRLAAKQGVSYFAVLLSSVAVLLARVSRQRRFVISFPAADQPVKGRPGLVGQCVSLLPFSVDLRDGEAFSEFLRRVQDDLVAAQENSAFTMVSLLEELRPDTNAIGRSPISAGFTSVKRFRPHELQQSGFTVSYDSNPKAYQSFEFYLNAFESEDGLDFRCHYDLHLFEDLTIGKWLKDLGAILEDVSASPWRGVLELARIDGADAAAEVILSRLPSGEGIHEVLLVDSGVERNGAGLRSDSGAHIATSVDESRRRLSRESDTASRVPPIEPGNSRVAAAGAVQSMEGLERVLAGWWQDFLGIEHVALDDDFFALGGHSLTGVRLFTKIRKTYGLDLELAILFEARTVRKLAAAIRSRGEVLGEESKKSTSLVPIQASGSRVPFFCVHALGGDVIFYEQLARALGPDQPFYAFQSPLVSDATIREMSIEELASTYVRDMISFFPKGPYMIGGASFGGLIAFEMGRQLHALGKKPSLLVLFDTAVPDHERRVDAKTQIARFWEGLRLQGPRYLRKKAAVKAQYWGGNLYHLLQQAACTAFRITGRPLPLSLHYFQVGEAHTQAQDRYVFRPYAGTITLIRAVDRGPENLSKIEDSTLGWSELAGGGLEIHDVDTKHMFMLFEPYVKRFVEQLTPLLRP